MVKLMRGLWTQSLRQNWPSYFFIAAVFILGLAAGVLGAQAIGAEQYQELSLFLDQFLQQAGVIEVDSAQALKATLYNDLILVLAVYLLGLTVIGIPVMLGIIFIRGFILGFTLEFLASAKSLQGLLLACAAILPKNILLIPALLMAGVASLSFSLLLARRFFNSKVQIWPSFVVYSGLMLLLAVFSAGAGLLEVYVTPVLVKLAAGYIM